jgi:hypothetical protein
MKVIEVMGGEVVFMLILLSDNLLNFGLLRFASLLAQAARFISHPFLWLRLGTQALTYHGG